MKLFPRLTQWDDVEIEIDKDGGILCSKRHIEQKEKKINEKIMQNEKQLDYNFFKIVIGFHSCRNTL